MAAVARGRRRSLERERPDEAARRRNADKTTKVANYATGCALLLGLGFKDGGFGSFGHLFWDCGTFLYLHDEDVHLCNHEI